MDHRAGDEEAVQAQPVGGGQGADRRAEAGGDAGQGVARRHEVGAWARAGRGRHRRGARRRGLGRAAGAVVGVAVAVAGVVAVTVGLVGAGARATLAAVLVAPMGALATTPCGGITTVLPAVRKAFGDSPLAAASDDTDSPSAAAIENSDSPGATRCRTAALDAAGAARATAAHRMGTTTRKRMGVIVPEIGFGGNLCNPARSLQFVLHSADGGETGRSAPWGNARESPELRRSRRPPACARAARFRRRG